MKISHDTTLGDLVAMPEFAKLGPIDLAVLLGIVGASVRNGGARKFELFNRDYAITAPTIRKGLARLSRLGFVRVRLSAGQGVRRTVELR